VLADTGGRRALGTGVALVLVATAALASRQLDASRSERVTAEAGRLAGDAALRVRDAWAVQSEALALLATTAGSNPMLLAALRGGVDSDTLADIVRDEEWWRPYRDASAALSYTGASLVYTQDPDITPLAQALVAEVRAEARPLARTSSVLGGRALLLAGVPISWSRRGVPAVLVLARRLDDEAMKALATRTQTPVILSDDRGVLSSGGRAEDLALLRLAVGHEQAGYHYALDGAWSAVSSPLATRLWLWTGARATDLQRSLAASDRRKKSVIFVLALLAAAASIVLAFRRVPAGQPQRSSGTPGDGVPLAPMSAGPTPRLLPARSPTPGVGVTLGRYLLIDRIGEGGMAEVFSAVSFGAGGFRRFFVVKRLRPEMASNATAVAHFVDEANLASTLVHPNIVPVFDFGEIGGTYYLAQEYVAGRDLGRLCRRMVERGDRMLSTRAILFLAHELLAALEYAHERRDDDGTSLDIVHRDVTPENVIVSERGEVKLLDFGIVKTSTGRLAQTEIGHVKGNVDFMAPEQARGRAVDRRADLFSVGLVIYYAATGAPLYNGETLFDRLNKAATGPGPEEREKIAALPAPLPEILERALAVNPDERFQTASDFRVVVAQYADGGDSELSAALTRGFERDLQLEQERLTHAFPRVRTRDLPASEGAK
jgi:hypothetical protein